MGLTTGELTNEQAVAAERAIKAMDAVVKAGKERLRRWVRQRGDLVSGDKVWGPVRQKGRDSVSVARVRELAPPELADKLIIAGKPSERFVWRNAK